VNFSVTISPNAEIVACLLNTLYRIEAVSIKPRPSITCQYHVLC
jgi:hypothetical protein